MAHSLRGEGLLKIQAVCDFLSFYTAGSRYQLMKYLRYRPTFTQGFAFKFSKSHFQLRTINVWESSSIHFSCPLFRFQI